MKKYWKIFPLALAILCCLGALRRELWFDEALTVTNFMLPLSISEIYSTYPIPNNQIVYTICLKLWDLFYVIPQIDYVVFWRLLSLIMATASLGLWINLREKLDGGKLYCAILTASAPAVSAVFINYATALRGYAASWLFIMLALWGLYDIFHQKSQRGWWLYIAGSILAVGTVPTNILALTAAVCYALPWMSKEFWRDKRFYLALATIPGALILFYAPIAKQFLHTFTLNEGFASRFGALLIIAGMYVALFGLLLLLAPWGITKGSWQGKLRYAIWFFPAIAVLILHKAPFPRVFVTLMPILMLLVADGLANVFKSNWKRFHKAAFLAIVIFFQILLIPAGFVIAENTKLSRYEDDFFHPWYMLPDYRITEVLPYIKGNVFLSFNSDPTPLLFYAAINNRQANFYADLPNGKVTTIPYGTLLILRNDEDASLYEKRFNGKMENAGKSGNHQLFYLRKNISAKP